MNIALSCFSTAGMSKCVEAKHTASKYDFVKVDFNVTLHNLRLASRSMQAATVQLIFAGQGLARRRDEPLLCFISISDQQDVDSDKNSLHEGRLCIQFWLYMST